MMHDPLTLSSTQAGSMKWEARIARSVLSWYPAGKTLGPSGPGHENTDAEKNTSLFDAYPPFNVKAIDSKVYPRVMHYGFF